MFSALVDNKNLNDFQIRLDSFRVKIILQDTVKHTENFKHACYVALNLLPRLLKSVRYAGDHEILAMLLPSHISKINIGVDDWYADVTLVFGDKPEPSEKNVLYIGSSGWSAYISKNRPCGWKVEKNNLSALYVGALSVGEVFKKILPELNQQEITHFEYDLITHGKISQPVIEPKIPEIIDYDDLLIIGCGAIGQAYCSAIKFAAKIKGKIKLVDHDHLEPSNEQRYIHAFEELRGRSKSELMGTYLASDNTTCTPITIPIKYEDYINLSNEFFNKEVIVMVDTIQTRLNVQAGLPKILWNAWTDVAKGSLRYGIGHHCIDGEYECLGCAYYPTGSSPTEMDMNVIMTGLSQEEIKQKLAPGYIVSREDIQRISQSKRIPIQKLSPNIGKPFQNLLHGDCGVFTHRIHGQDVVAPAPHVPTLAGIILASQVILRKLNIPKESKLIESASYESLHIPNSDCITNLKKHPNCFCNDQEYKQAYAKKWY